MCHYKVWLTEEEYITADILSVPPLESDNKEVSEEKGLKTLLQTNY